MMLPKRLPRRASEPIAPLIDMVFLLLLFFMLVGTIEPLEPFSVEPPKASQTDKAHTGTLMIHVGKADRLAFEGQVMDLATLITRIAERRAQEVAEPSPVALKADAAVDSGRVIAILQALREVGVHQVVLLTWPEEP